MSPISAVGAPAFGVACSLGSALTWALTGLIVRSLRPHVGSLALNAARSTAAGCLLVPVVLLTEGTGAFTSVSSRALWLMVGSIVAALTIGDTVFFESTRLLGLARAMTISTTYPVVSALLAWAFLDETLTPRIVAGSVVTLTGVCLIVVPSAGRLPDGGAKSPADGALGLGIAAATLAALMWALSVVFMRPALQEVDPITAQAIRLPIGGVLLWMTPWARGGLASIRASSRSVRWQIFGLSVLTAGSSVLFAAGLKYAGVTLSSVLSSTAPLFAIPLGWALLGERVSLSVVAGGIVTVAGIVILRT